MENFPKNQDDENHKKFLKSLEESFPAVFVMAQWLHGPNFDILVWGYDESSSHATAKRSTDKGDIWRRDRSTGLWRRYEVKRRKYEFTCMKDFPYPTSYVGSRVTIDNSNPPSVATFVLNHSMTHAGIILTSNKAQWLVTNPQDGRYDEYKQPTYECPKEFIKFICLSDRPKEVV